MEVGKLKVDELRRQLKARGLDASGNKAALQARLVAALGAGEHGDDASNAGHEEQREADDAHDAAQKARSKTSRPELVEGAPNSEPAARPSTEGDEQAAETVDTAVDAQNGAAQAAATEKTGGDVEAAGLSDRKAVMSAEEQKVFAEEERRRARAARFGTAYVPSAAALQLKKRARSDRFKSVTDPAPASNTAAAAATPAISEVEQARRAKRAARFAATSAS